jgi:putative PIN family toxin of toxin-antitoxin system
LFLLQNPYRVLYSDSLLNELDDVIHRPRHWNKVKHSEYKNTVQWLEQNGIRIAVQTVVDVCRDPKDNYLLALAKDGNADYLITDDKDLLVLQQFGKTKIAGLTTFEKE